ncbi:prepilin-type N-terminal cleavage/methylation domain-containing protein [Sporosalibacterium faouarense]|uniref:prepilin-type N-terminal cleavage/methylation domain-containing protein n=1 Tax=Sporosalibacterium faouarense TaxID=516123 RepID=UPI00192B7363|nr:prepilin-type N-terminal cleavage/methylation domain-containing protein [Sporosalibacterium faouarense]
MKKILMNNKGITLIEIIVTIAILSIIIIPVFSMFLTTAKANRYSDDKMKSTIIGQKVMEDIKSSMVIEEGTNNRNIDDYSVEINIEAVSDYMFPEASLSGEADINDYDIRIVISEEDDSGSMNFNYDIYRNYPVDENLNNDSSFTNIIPSDEATINLKYDGNIIIYDRPNKENSVSFSITDDPKIRLEVYRDTDITVNAENTVSSDELVIYMMKSSDSNAEYNLKNRGGNIKTINNINISDGNNNEARVYKINIKVFSKQGEKIEEITGYKTFLK